MSVRAGAVGGVRKRIGVSGCSIQSSDCLKWTVLNIDLKVLSLKSFIGLVVSLFQLLGLIADLLISTSSYCFPLCSFLRDASLLRLVFMD